MSPQHEDTPADAGILDTDDLFHTGLVVEDLDEAMEKLRELAGHRWTTVMEIEVNARTAQGVQHISQRFVLSLDEPRLELVEAVPGTLWTSNGSNGAHHVGYWAEDIEATSAALVKLGLPVEASDAPVDGPPMWIYHRGLGGIRVELLSRLMKPAMDAWISASTPVPAHS